MYQRGEMDHFHHGGERVVRAADAPASRHLDARDTRAVEGEGALHADAGGDTTHGEGVRSLAEVENIVRKVGADLEKDGAEEGGGGGAEIEDVISDSYA